MKTKNEDKIYQRPISLQLPDDYVPHPMHDIIATLIASALNMTLQLTRKIIEFNNYKVTKHH